MTQFTGTYRKAPATLSITSACILAAVTMPLGGLITAAALGSTGSDAGSAVGAALLPPGSGTGALDEAVRGYLTRMSMSVSFPASSSAPACAATQAPAFRPRISRLLNQPQ